MVVVWQDDGKPFMGRVRKEILSGYLVDSGERLIEVGIDEIVMVTSSMSSAITLWLKLIKDM